MADHIVYYPNTWALNISWPWIKIFLTWNAATERKSMITKWRRISTCLDDLISDHSVKSNGKKTFVQFSASEWQNVLSQNTCLSHATQEIRLGWIRFPGIYDKMSGKRCVQSNKKVRKSMPNWDREKKRSIILSSWCIYHIRKRTGPWQLRIYCIFWAINMTWNGCRWCRWQWDQVWSNQAIGQER